MVNDETVTSLLDPTKPLHVIRPHKMVEPSNLPIIVRSMVLALVAAILLTIALPLETRAPAKPASQPYTAQTYAPLTFPSPPYVEPSEPRTEATRASRSAVTTERTLPNKVEIVISFALAQQGKRYVFGAAGPNTFDCSGLVLRAFAQIGMDLYHYTGEMMKYGKSVSRAGLQRGDIVFPTSGHVGIYLGNNQFVNASSGKGKVIVNNLYSFYTARRLV